MELGYYDAATVGASFVGSWVPLTGSLTSPGNRRTIGDFGGLPDGRFSIADLFDEFDPDVPAIGTPLSLRFYDGTSIESSQFFNTVSTYDAKFRWPSRPNGLVLFNLDDPSIYWEGGPTSAFRTAIPIPEATALGFMALGIALIGGRSRREAGRPGRIHHP
jgi:hypothetical protein